MPTKSRLSRADDATCWIALALLAASPAFLQGQQGAAARTSAVPAVTEQLVNVRTEDGIVDGGALFAPAQGPAKPIAVIWIHGNGVNFYYPTYVTIARELARRGLTTITANTRMHDLGNIAAFRGDTRIRGGSYWGITSEQVRDLAAWIQLAKDRGFDRVVLVGHSAGATAVQTYASATQDARVVGIVLASGRFRPGTGPVNADRLALAESLVAAGRGEDALPPRSGVRPSPTSAGTLADLAHMGVNLTDFYGVQTPNPPVARIRAPILAWFGTNEADIGTAADLELLETTLKRSGAGPSRVSTVMIRDAGHMYDGQEAQVAQTLADWVDRVVLGGPGKAP